MELSDNSFEFNSIEVLFYFKIKFCQVVRPSLKFNVSICRISLNFISFSLIEIIILWLYLLHSFILFIYFWNVLGSVGRLGPRFGEPEASGTFAQERHRFSGTSWQGHVGTGRQNRFLHRRPNSRHSHFALVWIWYVLIEFISFISFALDFYSTFLKSWLNLFSFLFTSIQLHYTHSFIWFALNFIESIPSFCFHLTFIQLVSDSFLHFICIQSSNSLNSDFICI